MLQDVLSEVHSVEKQAHFLLHCDEAEDGLLASRKCFGSSSIEHEGAKLSTNIEDYRFWDSVIIGARL